MNSLLKCQQPDNLLHPVPLSVPYLQFIPAKAFNYSRKNIQIFPQTSKYSRKNIQLFPVQNTGTAFSVRLTEPLNYTTIIVQAAFSKQVTFSGECCFPEKNWNDYVIHTSLLSKKGDLKCLQQQSAICKCL